MNQDLELKDGQAYLEGTVLVSGYLVVSVTVAVQWGKHDTEGACPLAKEDEKVMS